MDSISLFMYTETTLHAGVGSTVSAVDLPIQRERTTGYPIVYGSGVKGALRSQYTDDNSTELVFGADTQSDDKFAGAVSVGDARIILFPLRSLMGVFAYATSLDVLARLKRDIPALPIPTTMPDSSSAMVTSGSELIAEGKVILEEFTFDKVDGADDVAEWLATHALPQTDAYAYWRHKIRTSLVILPDDAFRDFTLNSTEVVTRVRLDPDKKTVQDGALWTQEALPSDSLLVSTIITRRPRNGAGGSASDVAQQFAASIPSRLQLGGDETTGRGFVACQLFTGGN